jgi:energy-coupling factor transport system permease protein
MAFEYIPGKDFLHRRDPRAKLLLAVTIVIMSVWFTDPVWLIAVFFALVIVMRLAHIPLGKIAGFIRAISPVAAVYLLFNLIVPPVVVPNSLVMFYFVSWTIPPLFPVSVESFVWAIGALFRFLIILTVIRTVLMLTPIRDIILALVKLRIPPEFALAVSIGLGYLPVLIDENRRIKEAQQARGWEYEFRNPAKRFSALLLKMLIPSIANSMRRTQDIATAIESRGFGFNLRGRTYLHEIKIRAGDYLLLLVLLCVLASAAFVRGVVVGGRFVFGLGLADFQATARFVRAWVTTPAYTAFQGWMSLINWSGIPFVGLINYSYMHVEYGQFLFLFLVGLIPGIIAGIASRGRNRKVAFLFNLLVVVPTWFICFSFIWPTLPVALPVLLSGGALLSLITLDISMFLAFFLLLFITTLWPYFGSVVGTTIGRYRGGKKSVFVPPEIAEEE